MSDQPFANPVAPAPHLLQEAVHLPRQPLTNDDFRKLLATPRVGSASGTTAARSRSQHRSHHPRTRKPVLSHASGGRRKRDEEASPEEPGSSSCKKGDKSSRQGENDVLSELALKYRDRAKERREGVNPDYVSNEDFLTLSSGANVAPDAKSLSDMAERRKQMIEESKFLGGDMEHTHLVKGLDYALLQKVKAELRQSQLSDEEDEDTGTRGSRLDSEIDRKDCRTQGAQSDASTLGDEFDVRSRMAVSVVRLLNQQQQQQRNELFLPFRMAYVVDLEGEDDVPVTVIRSKAECPALAASMCPDTSDIVINKVAAMIASHRMGRKERLETSREAEREETRAQPEPRCRRQASISKSRVLSIYEDLDDDDDDEDEEEDSADYQSTQLGKKSDT